MKRKGLSLILVIFLVSVPAWGTVAYVQGVSDYDNAASLTVTLPANVTAGNLLVATVGNLPAGSAVAVTVSDTLNGSFTQAGTSCFSAYDTQGGLFYFPNSAGGADTITLTLPASAPLSIDVAEYSGVSTSSPLDVAPLCGTDTTGNPTTPNITTLTANDLIVTAAPYPGNTGTVTVSSPYTMESPSGFGGMAYRAATTATSYTGATFTIQYAGDHVIGMIAAFKSASSPPPASTTQMGLFLVGP